MHRNVETVDKQLQAAENKLAAVLAIGRTTDMRTEEGLPVRDIFEELDDDGNVICKLHYIRILIPFMTQRSKFRLKSKRGTSADSSSLEKGWRFRERFAYVK